MARTLGKPGQLLLAIAFALSASVLGTIQHQTKLPDGTPIGLLFSLALVLLLSGTIRDRSSLKLPGFVFAALLGAIVFLIGQNLTGDILIPGNDLGLYWSFGSIAIATLVGLWPKIKI